MKVLILHIIQAYQKFVSPLFPPSCRFYPTCSSYAYQAIEKYGVLKGAKLALFRIFKCHPYHPGGCDPIP